MEKPDRRPVSLAGLGLISAGAVLGLALAAPAAAAPSDPSRSEAAPAAARSDPPHPDAAASGSRRPDAAPSLPEAAPAVEKDL
jgi:hypothetical protein